MEMVVEIVPELLSSYECHGLRLQKGNTTSLQWRRCILYIFETLDSTARIMTPTTANTVAETDYEASIRALQVLQPRRGLQDISLSSSNPIPK